MFAQIHLFWMIEYQKTVKTHFLAKKLPFRIKKLLIVATIGRRVSKVLQSCLNTSILSTYMLVWLIFCPSYWKMSKSSKTCIFWLKIAFFISKSGRLLLLPAGKCPKCYNVVQIHLYYLLTCWYGLFFCSSYKKMWKT